MNALNNFIFSEAHSIKKKKQEKKKFCVKIIKKN